MKPGWAAGQAAPELTAPAPAGVGALPPATIPLQRRTRPLADRRQRDASTRSRRRPPGQILRDLSGQRAEGTTALPGALAGRERSGWQRRTRVLVGSVLIGAMVIALGTRFRAEVVAKLSTVGAPNWSWLVLCGFASAGFFVTHALALRAASGLPLRLHAALAVQLAAAAANRLLPAGLGAIAVNVRYLERQHLTASAGLSAVAATKIAIALAHLAGIVAVTGLIGGSGAGNALHTPAAAIGKHLGSPAGVGCITVAVLAGTAVALHPRIRLRIKPALRTAGTHLTLLARSPRRTAALLLSAAGTKLTQIVALASCVWAFGGSESLLSIAMIYLVGAAVAGAMPTAGNVGALEPALALGLTAAGGDGAAMFAAVLVYRLISYWLPVLPGLVALTALRRRGAL